MEAECAEHKHACSRFCGSFDRQTVQGARAGDRSDHRLDATLECRRQADGQAVDPSERIRGRPSRAICPDRGSIIIRRDSRPLRPLADYPYSSRTGRCGLCRHRHGRSRAGSEQPGLRHRHGQRPRFSIQHAGQGSGRTDVNAASAVDTRRSVRMGPDAPSIAPPSSAGDRQRDRKRDPGDQAVFRSPIRRGWRQRDRSCASATRQRGPRCRRGSRSLRRRFESLPGQMSPDHFEGKHSSRRRGTPA